MKGGFQSIPIAGVWRTNAFSLRAPAWARLLVATAFQQADLTAVGGVALVCSGARGADSWMGRGWRGSRLCLRSHPVPSLSRFVAAQAVAVIALLVPVGAAAAAASTHARSASSAFRATSLVVLRRTSRLGAWCARLCRRACNARVCQLCVVVLRLRAGALMAAAAQAKTTPGRRAPSAPAVAVSVCVCERC
jgi:hypothetical protein